MDLIIGTVPEATLSVRSYEDHSATHRTQDTDPTPLVPGASDPGPHRLAAPLPEAPHFLRLRVPQAHPVTGPGHIPASWPEGLWECVFLVSTMGSWNRKMAGDYHNSFGERISPFRGEERAGEAEDGR